MLKREIPKRLQSVLWSVDIDSLDLDKDREYIIHQVLSYGDLSDLQWLFETYPKKTIVEVFLTVPYKDYRKSRLFFIKDVVLDKKGVRIPENQYVKNIPRDFRQREN